MNADLQTSSENCHYLYIYMSFMKEWPKINGLRRKVWSAIPQYSYDIIIQITVLVWFLHHNSLYAILFSVLT